ncbi:MAG: hypothetical protein ACK421_08370 [Pseudanabaenaceae cyanobacterium]
MSAVIFRTMGGKVRPIEVPEGTLGSYTYIASKKGRISSSSSAGGSGATGGAGGANLSGGRTGTQTISQPQESTERAPGNPLFPSGGTGGRAPGNPLFPSGGTGGRAPGNPLFPETSNRQPKVIVINTGRSQETVARENPLFSEGEAKIESKPVRENTINQEAINEVKRDEKGEEIMTTQREITPEEKAKIQEFFDLQKERAKKEIELQEKARIERQIRAGQQAGGVSKITPEEKAKIQAYFDSRKKTN